MQNDNAARSTISVTYRIESAGDPEAVALKIASDQSTGTFTDLANETEAVRARCAAKLVGIRPLEPLAQPSFPDPDGEGPYKRADAVIA